MCDRIAVVVVHGVGDPGAGHSSSAVASMLLAMEGGGGADYQPFYSSPVKIGVRACETNHVQPRRQAWFSERGPYVTAKVTGKGLRDSPPDVGYSEDQLSAYEPQDTDQTYETVRLSSVRRGIAGKPATQDNPEIKATPAKMVHVFEMYWADLVTVGKGVRLLGDLYQIVLHLSSVGQHAIDMAVAANPKSRSWWLFDFIHDSAVRLLCLPLPIFNLMLLAGAAIALSWLCPAWAAPAAAASVLWIVLSAGAAVALFKYTKPKNPWRNAITAVLAMLVAAGITMIPLKFIAPQRLLALEALLVTLALLFPILRAYASLRPGTWVFATVACLCTVVTGVYEIFDMSPDQMLLAALHVLELLWLILSVSWTILFLLTVASWFTGWLVVAAHWSSPVKCIRARRVTWTARLTLALPTVLFFILTQTLWAGVLYAVLKRLPLDQYKPGWAYQWLQKLGLSSLFDLSSKSIQDYAQSLWAANTGCVLGPIAALLLVSLLLAVWALLPCILSELSVPRDIPGRREKYANWLDGGFALLRIAGTVLFLASILIVPLGLPNAIWHDWPAAKSVHHWMTTNAPTTLKLVGGLVAGAAGLRLLPGRLGRAMGALAVPLRAALDVDAYLRQYPLKSNPKARIFARYVSMLRYLAKWTDPQYGCQYDRIVIVSHSQGTVITADLLRFLKFNPDPSLSRLFNEQRVHLFTMGCPLRQLYGRRLPHLYLWTDHELGAPFAKQKPDPVPLQIARWSNAYRSGDYIGRNLWLADKETSTWTEPVYGTNRAEFCSGPGAHVHYWDASDQLIAQEIDRLIND
jgi:hypothetical protein